MGYEDAAAHEKLLHQYDLSSKTIIPFNTNGGYGVGSGFQTVKDLCPGSTILEGFAVKGGSERDGEYLVIKDKKAERAQTEVKNWLRRTKIAE